MRCTYFWTATYSNFWFKIFNAVEFGNKQNLIIYIRGVFIFELLHVPIFGGSCNAVEFGKKLYLIISMFYIFPLKIVKSCYLWFRRKLTFY